MAMISGPSGKPQCLSFILIFPVGGSWFLTVCHFDNSYGSGKWTEASRKSYNLIDALTRHTVQVIRPSALVC